MFIKTTAVGPFEPVASCINGGATSAFHLFGSDHAEEATAEKCDMRAGEGRDSWRRGFRSAMMVLDNLHRRSGHGVDELNLVAGRTMFGM
jgi:hypothetical protein